PCSSRSTRPSASPASPAPRYRGTRPSSTPSGAGSPTARGTPCDAWSRTPAAPSSGSVADPDRRRVVKHVTAVVLTAALCAAGTLRAAEDPPGSEPATTNVLGAAWPRVDAASRVYLRLK